MRPFYARSKTKRNIIIYIFAIDGGVAYSTSAGRQTTKMRAIPMDQLLKNWDFIGHYA